MIIIISLTNIQTTQSLLNVVLEQLYLGQRKLKYDKWKDLQSLKKCISPAYHALYDDVATRQPRDKVVTPEIHPDLNLDNGIDT